MQLLCLSRVVWPKSKLMMLIVCMGSQDQLGQIALIFNYTGHLFFMDAWRYCRDVEA
jgi:hypothetical protein